MPYHVVDVFTDRAFAGNPLAVVLSADDLSTPAMQAIAKEFNLSETAFPVAVSQTEYTLRIFTPQTELPFAGHPSVGSAWLLHSLGVLSAGAVVQHCGAGALPVSVSASSVSLVAGAPAVEPPVDAAPFLEAVGLPPTASADARVCSAGLPFAFVQVSPSDVVAAVPDAARLRTVCGDRVAGVSVFSWSSGVAHTRVFAGGVGVLEDAATGSAAAAFGAWLAAVGYVPADGESAYVVEQGLEMRRPSRIEGTVLTDDGRAVECRIAGTAVAVAAGLIRVPE